MNARDRLPRFIAANIALLMLLTAVDTRTARADGPVASIPASGGTHLRYRVVVDQGRWNDIHAQQWNLPPDVAASIQAQFVDKLEKSGWFIVLDQDALGQAQPPVESQPAPVAGTGTGVTPAPPAPQPHTPGNYVLAPSVTEFVPISGGESKGRIIGIKMGNKKAETSVTLSIKITDTQTDAVLDTVTAVGTVEVKGKPGINLPANGFTSEQFQASSPGQAVDAALDDAVTKIVARVSQEPWTALVAAQDKNTNRIIINAGSRSGVEVGQVFDVFRGGAPVLDPDTGAKISNGDVVKVGRIKVARVERSASYADIVDGQSFQPRDIVKVAQ